MSEVWREEPEPERISAAGWARALLRVIPLAVVVFGGLAILLALRLIERPIWGQRRPLTPFITQAVCRTAFVILGIRYRTEGQAMQGPGAAVANHSSWLDIFALNARKRIYFVSKAEVAGWPGIGWLAKATGTVFSRSDPREAMAQSVGGKLHCRKSGGCKPAGIVAGGDGPGILGGIKFGNNPDIFGAKSQNTAHQFRRYRLVPLSLRHAVYLHSHRSHWIQRDRSCSMCAVFL